MIRSKDGDDQRRDAEGTGAEFRRRMFTGVSIILVWINEACSVDVEKIRVMESETSSEIDI